MAILIEISLKCVLKSNWWWANISLVGSLDVNRHIAIAWIDTTPKFTYAYMHALSEYKELMMLPTIWDLTHWPLGDLNIFFKM